MACQQETSNLEAAALVVRLKSLKSGSKGVGQVTIALLGWSSHTNAAKTRGVRDAVKCGEPQKVQVQYIDRKPTKDQACRFCDFRHGWVGVQHCPQTNRRLLRTTG